MIEKYLLIEIVDKILNIDTHCNFFFNNNLQTVNV